MELTKKIADAWKELPASQKQVSVCLCLEHSELCRALVVFLFCVVGFFTAIKKPLRTKFQARNNSEEKGEF